MPSAACTDARNWISCAGEAPASSVSMCRLQICTRVKCQQGSAVSAIKEMQQKRYDRCDAAAALLKCASCRSEQERCEQGSAVGAFNGVQQERCDRCDEAAALLALLPTCFTHPPTPLSQRSERPHTTYHNPMPYPNPCPSHQALPCSCHSTLPACNRLALHPREPFSMLVPGNPARFSQGSYAP